MSAPFLKKSYACAFPSMMEGLPGPILCSVAPQYPNPPGSELDKMRPFCEIDASPHRLFMSRSCLLFALVASFLFPTLARSARAETALAALRSLPPRYSYSGLRLSAGNGRPPLLHGISPRAIRRDGACPRTALFRRADASSQNGRL